MKITVEEIPETIPVTLEEKLQIKDYLERIGTVRFDANADGSTNYSALRLSLAPDLLHLYSSRK
jgi:hypothetical protein